MAKRTQVVDHQTVELDGVRYVIVRESVFDRLCKSAGVAKESTADEVGVDLDAPSLAEKLIRRRRASGLSQAELARRAGIRPETLNRIERGKTTPDFRTVRKLVVAMDAVEQEAVSEKITKPSKKQ